MNVLSYPIGEAARQYAAEVKPVVTQVAKKLGYVVGAYRGHGLPHTVLRAKDPAAPIAEVILYWHGRRLEAGVRSRKNLEALKTPEGRLIFAMTFGVHDAYGDSVAPDLATRIEQAITIAVDVFTRSQQP